jgi:hypothetical protein
VKRRRERRRKQLLEEEKRYWKLKEEAPDRALWRTGFGSLRACLKRDNKKMKNVVLWLAKCLDI